MLETVCSTEGKKAIVTGGSRGIGAGICLELGRRGWEVVLTYQTQRENALQVVAEMERLGATAYALQGDVSTVSGATALMEEGLSLLGGEIDALVCNAGVAYMGLLTDMTDAQWDNVINVNLNSMFYCSRPVIPTMVRQKRGHIITVSSMWGQVGASCEVAYSAAKAGVIGFTKALAKELAPSQIYVNCVAPGVIETDMIAMLTEEDKTCLKEEIPLERLGSREEVAKVVAFLLEESVYLTGQVLAPNGGLVV